MIGFDLLRPSLSWLLVVAPLGLLIGWRGIRRSQVELGRWVAPRHLARFMPGTSLRRARLRVLFGAAGLLFLALAALGPIRGYTYRAVSRKGLDLVVCLDTSRSMLAQDLRPSRLERAKREIVGLLDHMEGDRVALVAFSGDARDVAPLTRDRQTLERLLSFSTPEDNRRGGTDLAAAIEHALSLFDGRTGAHEAIVLLTDGEDLEGHASAQAEEAARRGIRLFVVGVGTEAGGKVPVLGSDGSPSFLRGPDGEEVVSKLGRESLVALARTTGGDFLSAEEAPTALEDLYRARISRIEGREIEGGEQRVPYDRFQWPLALGLLCLLVELTLRVRRRASVNQGSSPRLAAAVLPLLGLVAQETPSFSARLDEVVRHHRSGELEAAEQAAGAILARADDLGLDESERARAQFALGVVSAIRSLSEPEEGPALRATAMEALSLARALAGPGELRLDSTYDLGALELFHAEKVRATLPEISGQPPVPPPPAGGPPAPGAVPSEAPPDPLEEARALYIEARTWLIERLRLDWKDEDTRADLELIQRRLHELDQIEEERQNQEQPEQDPNSDQNEDPNQDQEKQDEKNKDQENQDQENDSDSKDPKEGGEPKDDSESKPPEGEEQEPKDPSEEDPQDSGEPQEGEGEQEQQPKPEPGGQPEKPSERVLTREEVMRLLDKLSDLEKQQQALQAALRARSRAATQRDW